MFETYDKKLLKYKTLLNEDIQILVGKSKTLQRINLIPSEIPPGMMQEAV